MDVNLIIPRHKHGGGTSRENINLSPDGKAALDRLATCSRSAAADLAIRVLDAVVFGDAAKLELVGQELVGALNSSDGLAWSSAGLEAIAITLDANLKVLLSN